MPNYPLIAVVGSSGSGKSYSLRNLPVETTRIINIERKPLPFKTAFKFGNNLVEVDNAIPESIVAVENALKDKKINVVVIESFTKYCELLLAQSKRINKGYDIYNYYNSNITNLLEKIKNNNSKIVIVIGIPEIVKEMTPFGGEISSRRIKVAGKEWEGCIEKEFTIVLFTDIKQEKGNPKADYGFMVNTDGTNSAKSPPDLFGTEKVPVQRIDNDLNFVVNKVMAYYELKPNYDIKATEEIEKGKILTSQEAIASVN